MSSKQLCRDPFVSSVSNTQRVGSDKDDKLASFFPSQNDYRVRTGSTCGKFYWSSIAFPVPLPLINFHMATQWHIKTNLIYPYYRYTKSQRSILVPVSSCSGFRRWAHTPLSPWWDIARRSSIDSSRWDGSSTFSFPLVPSHSADLSPGPGIYSHYLFLWYHHPR